MTLPKSVTVGGIKFRVIVRELPDHYGQMHFDSRLILVSRRSAEDARTAAETLRHEMLHAALHVSGVAFAERYEDEPVVRAIEHLFFPAWEATLQWLINHNPELA